MRQTCRQVWEWRAPNRRIGRGDLYPWLRGLWCRVSGHRNSWWHQWSWSGGCRTGLSSPPRSPSGRTWSPGPPRWSQCTETFNSVKFFAPVFTVIMVCRLVFVREKRLVVYVTDTQTKLSSWFPEFSWFVMTVSQCWSYSIDFHQFYQLYHE